MKKILLMGANGLIGKELLRSLTAAGYEIGIVSREKTALLFWDYKSDLPEFFCSYDLVINCARSNDFRHNVAVAAKLRDSLPETTRFICMSSNAIFAEPRNKFFRKIFKGDAYIREKKKIETIFKNRNNTIIFRPSIVLGNVSVWDDQISNLRNARNLFVNSSVKNAKIKVIGISELADAITTQISAPQCKIEKEIFQKIVSFDELTGIAETGKTADNNDFFGNGILNFVAGMTMSYIVPDWFLFQLQSSAKKRVLKKSNQKENHTKEDKTVSGMLRLYLGGHHTEG